MKIITVINDINHPNFHLLKLSCILNGLELVTLVSNKYNFYTRRIKDDLLYDYLSDESIDDDQIIFFTDGTDALFVADEKEILSKYNSFKKEIVFSTETGCWPDTDLAHFYPNNKVRSPYKYLNSGGFIGKAKQMKELLEDNDFDLGKYPESNQYLWAMRYFKHQNKIDLDTDCEIFCTFSPEIGKEYLPDSEQNDFSEYYKFKKKWLNENFIVNNNRMCNLITKTLPCHLHFNGNSKLMIDYNIFDLVYSNIQIHKPVQYYFEHD